MTLKTWRGASSGLVVAVALCAPAVLEGCPQQPMECGDGGGGGAGGGDASYGAPVVGPIDNHCYVNPVDGGIPGGPVQFTVVDPDHCNPDAGPPDSGQPPGPEFGPTNYNSEANDDDCKYQVGWWSTPIQYNAEVTFYVSVVRTADGTPVTGATANTYAEIASNSGTGTPPPDVGKAVTTEVNPGSGVYGIGPFLMNAHGQWQVRFHINENCSDLWPDSPHGHAAFYFTVP